MGQHEFIMRRTDSNGLGSEEENKELPEIPRLDILIYEVCSRWWVVGTLCSTVSTGTYHLSVLCVVPPT